MDEVIEEIKAQEALNPISNDFTDGLDAEGNQENNDIGNDDFQEILRPDVDFSEWHDDNAVHENQRNEGGKFRPLELMARDELLTRTKALVPEQMVVLQKVLDFVKSRVQCRNSRLARDSLD